MNDVAMQSFNVAHLLDRVPLLWLFLGAVVLMLLFMEIGFRVGIHRPENVVKAQSSQVRAIMGATLGLLAFMLAFTFSAAQSHFETRVNAMVEEARVAGDAFLQADFLPSPQRQAARELVHEYVADRVQLMRLAEQRQLARIPELIRKSGDLRSQLWELARDIESDAVGGPPGGVRVEPFRASVLSLTNLHLQRVHAAFASRIPWAVWATLFLTAALGMLVMGYHAGLTTRRSPLATVTLALSFAVVMMLITDLDRPLMSMFRIDDRVMVELEQQMAFSLEQERSPD